MTGIYQRESYNRVEGEARQLYVEAVAAYPGFTLPMPMRACDRCFNHAALSVFDDNWDFTPEEDRIPVEYVCGPCGRSVSLFAMPMPHDDLRQLAADAALEEAMQHG